MTAHSQANHLEIKHNLFPITIIDWTVSALATVHAADRNKWGLVSSDKCGCGMVQTMSHIVDECPVSKLHDGGLQRLHSANDVAVNWLQGTAMKVLVK